MSRGRRWRVRLAWGLAAALGLAVLASAWLVGSDSGARFVLGRLAAALPEGSLQWQTQRGSFARGLVLEGVSYRQDGLQVEVEHLGLQLAASAVLAGQVRIPTLEVEGLRVVLPAHAEAETEPFEFELPESLPSLTLPFGVAIDAARLQRLRIERAAAVVAAVGDAQPSPPLFVADLMQLSVLSLQDGLLRVDALDLDAPTARARLQGEIDGAATWRLALQLEGDWREGLQAPQPFEATLNGPLESLQLRLRLPDAPGFALDFELGEGWPRPRWRVELRASEPPPALAFLWPHALNRLQLRGEGGLDQAELAGDFSLLGRDYRLQTASLRLQRDRLLIDRLLLSEGEGQAELQGQLELPGEPASPRFELTMAFSRFTMPVADSPAVRIDGRVGARGELDDIRVELALDLERDGLAGTVRGGLALEAQQAQLIGLELGTRDGRLRADGLLEWQDGFGWQIDAVMSDFDAGLFLSEWPSRLSAQLRSEGRASAQLREGELRLSDLRGQLRGRGLEGAVQATWRGVPARADALLPVAALEAELDLRWGDASVVGRAGFGDELEAELRLASLRLDGLLGALAGELSGEVTLAGRPSAPRLSLDLTAPALGVAAVELGGFSARGEIGLSPDSALDLHLQSTETRVAGRALGPLDVALRGDVAAHVLALTQPMSAGGLAVEISGGWREAEQRWLGRLQQLEWRAPEARSGSGDWALAEPKAIEFGARRVRIDAFCVEGETASRRRTRRPPGDERSDAAATAPGSAGAAVVAPRVALGRVCVSADGEGADVLSAQLELEAVPVSWPLGLWVAESALDRTRWQGELEGAIDFTSRAGGWRLDGRLASARGALLQGRGADGELLAWEAFSLELAGDAAELRLGLAASLGESGFVRGDMTARDIGTAGERLEGQLALQLDQLGVIELLSESSVVAPAGQLSAELALEGSLAAPRLRGGARLSDVRAELPALGIHPREGVVELRLEEGDAAELRLELRSEGVLRGRGRIDWSGQAETPVSLELTGQEVLLSDTPQLRLAASPELTLEQRDGLLRVRGGVRVPRAEIRLDRFENSQQVSADVVVLDPAAPEAAVAAAQQIDADVRLALGEDVALAGFGLNGKVSGELRVRDRPGRATRASGSLNVSGRYKAYGQDLAITRGRLSFAQSPLDNPGLDIRAERRLEQVTVGIRVTGSAAAPVLGLWSQPSLDQADVLSYLMLGRPVSRIRSGEGQQLNAAAAALGAGGNFIAERLGERLGFDQASVEESAALGGAALMLGKFLSPRLYVAYGVALFGEGQLFSIKYLLSEQWDLQLEATQRETRGSVNYRLER